MDAETKATLEAAGVDSILATHIGHLWARDPLVIFKERIEIDDEQLSDHFENIQSTNWQTVRWKPPPFKSSPCSPHIGAEMKSVMVESCDRNEAKLTN